MFRFPLKTLHIFVLLSLALFLVVQILKFHAFSKPDWIFHYLNDFITIPMVATICLHVIWAIKKDRTIRLNIFTIISLVALFSLYFEFYLPKQSTRYTGDLWDVVCYFLGGMLFYFLQNIPSKKHRKISFIAKKHVSLK